MKELTDIELLDIFKEDRNRALEEIYDRYAGLVYGVCLKYLGNKEKSMDAVVEVFELLIKKVADQNITNFSSWLYSVTKNHCLMILRKEKSELKHINEFYLESDNIDEDNHIVLPEYKHVQEALCLLTYEQKECVTMFYYNDMSYNEIADVTGFSVKSVKSYLQNGRIKLKKIMEEQKNANHGYQ
ncbi:MAG: RNA polymerase subunit sigma-24 [Marinilabiliales bacterium]|nr:MAG: RNA polymerase subunit sigma-24 [Marinilabiliales bacterium]